MADGMTVMILAQYYSLVKIQAHHKWFGEWAGPFQGPPALPGNPIWPTSIFSLPQEQAAHNPSGELYRVPWGEEQPTCEQLANYGFKPVFWSNTHHYFADFYHNYFLGEYGSAVIDLGRELYQSPPVGVIRERYQSPPVGVINNWPETIADTQMYFIAQAHARAVAPPFISLWTLVGGPISGTIIRPIDAFTSDGGTIENLPALLKTDACEKRQCGKS